MTANRSEHSLVALFTVALAGLLLTPQAIYAQQEEKRDQGEIPQKVMDALKAKFPRAEIDQWTKEIEGDFIIYDFEFKQDGQKFEADIKEDGTFHNWEKQIAVADLPDAVKKVIEEKYPESALQEIMEITALKDGQDVLEGYEVVLKTADKKVIEVTVAPDGQILEDSADEN